MSLCFLRFYLCLPAINPSAGTNVSCTRSGLIEKVMVSLWPRVETQLVTGCIPSRAAPPGLYYIGVRGGGWKRWNRCVRMSGMRWNKRKDWGILEEERKLKWKNVFEKLKVCLEWMEWMFVWITVEERWTVVKKRVCGCLYVWGEGLCLNEKTWGMEHLEGIS